MLYAEVQVPASREKTLQEEDYFNYFTKESNFQIVKEIVRDFMMLDLQRLLVTSNVNIFSNIESGNIYVLYAFFCIRTTFPLIEQMFNEMTQTSSFNFSFKRLDESQFRARYKECMSIPRPIVSTNYNIS